MGRSVKGKRTLARSDALRARVNREFGALRSSRALADRQEAKCLGSDQEDLQLRAQRARGRAVDGQFMSGAAKRRVDVQTRHFVHDRGMRRKSGPAREMMPGVAVVARAANIRQVGVGLIAALRIGVRLRLKAGSVRRQRQRRRMTRDAQRRLQPEIPLETSAGTGAKLMHERRRQSGDKPTTATRSASPLEHGLDHSLVAMSRHEKSTPGGLRRCTGRHKPAPVVEPEFNTEPDSPRRHTPYKPAGASAGRTPRRSSGSSKGRASAEKPAPVARLG
jgi:hypothetical protein